MKKKKCIHLFKLITGLLCVSGAYPGYIVHKVEISNAPYDMFLGGNRRTCRFKTQHLEHLKFSNKPSFNQEIQKSWRKMFNMSLKAVPFREK